MNTYKFLVIGALGQIGSELTAALRKKVGYSRVIASDIKNSKLVEAENYPYEALDVMDKDSLRKLVKYENIKEIYMLAAILSAAGEENPQKAWEVNMQSLLNVLDVAVEENVKKVFWPSSIAVFGSDSPKDNCPQFTVTQPATVYGISKNAGENWCNYYHRKYGLDVRSLRYPGLIGYKTMPGGGTTDYAVSIYHSAVKGESYECYLTAKTALPMMYMPDAVRATLMLMDAPAEKITVRTSYNLSGITFTPEKIAGSIRKHIPGFSVNYRPDFRQDIANSWPRSIDDSFARKDWGWQNKFDLDAMTADMLKNLREQYFVKH